VVDYLFLLLCNHRRLFPFRHPLLVVLAVLVDFHYLHLYLFHHLRRLFLFRLLLLVVLVELVALRHFLYHYQFVVELDFHYYLVLALHI